MDFGTIVTKHNQILLDPVADPVGTNEGRIYYDSDDDNVYVRTTAGEVDLTAGAGSPAGSDTQIQYNNNGSFGAITTIIWDDTNLEFANDQAVAWGTDADYTLNFDDSVDDQLLIETNLTAAGATTDPMIQYLFDADTANGTGMTENQQVWGLAKGTQASNADLITVDEDGDVVITGDLTVGGSHTITTLTTTSTTTLGDGTGTVEVASSSWDVSTAGAVSGITTLEMSGNLTISAGDVILANDKAVKGSTTNAETVLIQAYDVDNTTYRNVITMTNGNTIALALGSNYETVAVNSSDWDISTTGALSGIGAIDMDGALSITNATPTINLKDGDAAAGDDNATLTAAATDTGDGSEDVDVTLAQQIAGTIRNVAVFDADGDITLGYGTQNVVATADVTVTGSDLTLGTAGVKLTGDGDGAITFLGLGDGSDEDLTLNLDDTENKAVWSETQGIDEWILTDMGIDVDKVEISKATPEIEFYDTDCGDGDMSAEILITATTTASGSEDIDVTLTQQSDGSNHNFLVADADGNLTLDSGDGTINMTDNVVFNGGQTRKVKFVPKDVELDGTEAPALTDIGTDGQCNVSALAFDADGGGSDDSVYISWQVPDGYIDDSATLLIAYTFSTAEDAADEAQFDFTVDAVAAGETIDAAGTATADQTTVISDASADNGKLHITEYDCIEKEEIDVDDFVTIKITVDVSASALAASGTLDVLYFEIEYESTE